MKKHTIVALALLLAASVASVSPAQAYDNPAKTHVLAAEVVKVDVDAKMLTVKAEDKAEMTMPCRGKAVEELKTVTAGEKVNVTCEDNAKGEHQAFIDIKPAPPAQSARSAK